MKIIGLTGGIGSGKSTLLKFIQQNGIPCFESDKVGKELLDTQLKKDVINSFGSYLYETGKLDRNKLAELVFNDSGALNKLNNIVHPAVGRVFEKFKVKKRDNPIIIIESAILFETGIYKNCDLVILVCAPLEDRILRVIHRDGSNREAVLKRIVKQWDDIKKRPLANFIIENNTLEIAKYQLEKILTKLLTH